MMSARRGGGKRKRGTNKETEKKNGNVSNKKWRVTKPQQDKETEEYLQRNNFQHCLDKDQEYIFVNVPTVVVIESNTEPSKELAIKSLQSATEEGTITMRTGRVPYIPLQERDRQVEKTSSRIFTLFWLSEELKDEFKELVKDRVQVGKVAHQAARDWRAIG
ncbi:unnamed protein product [Brassica rapa]|uniref:Uncharacterized protein n=1 Tax=Brassica campestris TaxID=3711 RepID=A0A8D9I3G6_BRACM|nr:unnamed protein product [Brassica rapa]